MSTIVSTTAITEKAEKLHNSRPSFFGLVRGELFKVVRQWTPWILLVMVAGIIFLPFLLMFRQSDLKSFITAPDAGYFYGRVAATMALFRSFAGIALLIVTARMIGQEYSQGTIRIVLARGVGRVQLLLAKITAAVCWAIFLLAFGLALIALLTVVQVQIVTGSLNALTNLPSSVWHDLGTFVVTILISMGATILMATAVSVIFRTLAGALSGAIAWFAIDNMLVLMLLLMSELTGSDFWRNASAYLLGPNLNTMAGAITGIKSSVWHFGFTPMSTTPVDGNHTLIVAAVYSAIFVVVAIVLTWKRDVKE